MLVSDQTDINFGSKTYQFRTTGYQNRVKKMLFLGQEYINFGPRYINFRSNKCCF